MSMVLYSIILILLILILLITIYFTTHDKKEHFSDFSPYYGDYSNNRYPSIYEKNNDYRLLQKTLEKWEKPFNSNDEGYRNAESPSGPPLVPIYSYTPMKHL